MLNRRGNPALHFLDRYLGIPIIAVLGSLRRKRKRPDIVDRIGLLRTAAIGDTVLLSAAISDLRRAYPHAFIALFAGPSNFEIAQMLQGIDRVIQVPISPGAGTRAIRSVPVDVMIDFGQWPRLDALLALFSKASYTIGFRTPGQHRHFGYDSIVDHLVECHESKNFQRLLGPLGIEIEGRPFLPVPQAATVHTEDYAVCHLWAGGRRRGIKQWPTERWIQLISEFSGWGLKVFLTGAMSDRERNEQIITHLRRLGYQHVVNAAGIELKRTAVILASARLVVSVDTGVMHMAAALGAPVVALHGPTSATRWGPIGSNVIAVESTLPDCGYVSLGWENSPLSEDYMKSVLYPAVRDACEVTLKRGLPDFKHEELPESVNDIATKTGCRRILPGTVSL